ncbi:MAG: hypothetical protein QOK23_2297 [Gammaproteobacteria bacterium]|nr:hypothetical protein [Gammaproteobacteria bacterium]
MHLVGRRRPSKKIADPPLVTRAMREEVLGLTRPRRMTTIPLLRRRCAKVQKGFDILEDDHGVIIGAIYTLVSASRE